MVRLLGPQDRLLTTIERQYPVVNVHVRGNEISLSGPASDVEAVRRLIEERGADYAALLAERYPDVGSVSDYVVYWFRLAHDHLPAGGRAGLVGTNSVREVSSRAARVT